MGAIIKNGIVYGGAMASTQSDWAEADSSADSYILNKPTLGTASAVDTTTTIADGGTGVPTSGTVYSALAQKVDAVSGKGLSENDFTNTDKAKLDGIASGAEVNIQADWNQTNTSADDYIKNKPTDLSAFSNSTTQYITKAVSDLANYYTTSETYTQTEVNALISAIPKFKIEVVDSLLIDNPSPTTIYLLLNTSTSTQNLYTEYIYIIPETGQPYFEKLGEQTIDLTNYYTTSQVDSLITNAQSHGYRGTVSGISISERDLITNLGMQNVIPSNLLQGDTIFLKTNTDIDANYTTSIEDPSNPSCCRIQINISGTNYYIYLQGITSGGAWTNCSRINIPINTTIVISGFYKDQYNNVFGKIMGYMGDYQFSIIKTINPGDTSATFTDDRINENSIIDIYTDHIHCDMIWDTFTANSSNSFTITFADPDDWVDIVAVITNKVTTIS